MTEQQPDQQPDQLEDAAGGGAGADLEGGAAGGAGGVDVDESGARGASATDVDTASEGPAGPTVWRPYGYADSETGTTDAAGAELRHGPATGQLDSPDVEDARTVNEQLAARVLVPDDDATREAERHPNVAPPAADVEGEGGGADVEGGDDAD